MRTGNNHFKFVPPMGPIVIMSSHEREFKPAVRDMEKAGLILGSHIERMPKMESKEIVAVMVPPIPPPKEEAKPMVRKLQSGKLQAIVIEILTAEPSRLWNKDEVYERIREKAIDTTGPSVLATLSSLTIKGLVRRPGRGVYSLNRDAKLAVPALPRLSRPIKMESDSGMLEEDAAVLDQFLEALAALQAWAEKLRKR